MLFCACCVFSSDLSSYHVLPIWPHCAIPHHTHHLSPHAVAPTNVIHQARRNVNAWIEAAKAHEKGVNGAGDGGDQAQLSEIHLRRCVWQVLSFPLSSLVARVEEWCAPLLSPDFRALLWSTLLRLAISAPLCSASPFCFSVRSAPLRSAPLCPALLCSALHYSAQLHSTTTRADLTQTETDVPGRYAWQETYAETRVSRP